MKPRSDAISTLDTVSKDWIFHPLHDGFHLLTWGINWEKKKKSIKVEYQKLKENKSETKF